GAPDLAQHAQPVAERDLPQRLVVVTARAQRLEHTWQAGDVADLVRDGGPVEVGAERDVVDAYLLGDVVDVADDVCDRCPRVEAAVGPEHRDAEGDADDTAGRCDCAQLRVGQVPRRGAHRVRVRVRRDDGPGGAPQHPSQAARV